MICATCGESLKLDAPLGYVHPSNRSVIGKDGHIMVPVRDDALDTREVGARE